MAVVEQGGILVGAGALGPYGRQVGFVLLAQPLRDLGSGAQSGGEFRQRLDGFRGRLCLGKDLLLVDRRVARQPGPAHHARQQQSLHHEGHHDDAGGDEDDEGAVGEGGARVDALRYGQRHSQRYRAPEAGEAADGTCPVTDPPQPLLRAPVDQADQVGGGEQEREPNEDQHHADHTDRDQGIPQLRAAQVAEGVLEFHPDQDEQGTVDDERRQRPERQRLATVLGADQARSHLGHDQATHDDREYTRGVHQFGEQIGRERGQDHDEIAEQGVVEAAPQVHVDPGDRHADRGAAAVRQQEQRSDVRKGEVFLSDGDADRQPVDDQRRTVVDEALRP